VRALYAAGRYDKLLALMAKSPLPPIAEFCERVMLVAEFAEKAYARYPVSTT
jgi:hypothetical protein